MTLRAMTVPTISIKERRYTFVECRVQSTIVNGPDGRPTQLTFGDEGYIDYFGRPWAQNWEEHFEQGLTDPPAESGVAMHDFVSRSSGARLDGGPTRANPFLASARTWHPSCRCRRSAA